MSASQQTATTSSAEEKSTPEKKSSQPSPKVDLPWTLSNGVYATYDLHCHCASVRYKMRISPPLYAEQAEGKGQCVAIDCECSYCARNGLLLVHPLAEDVEFTHGVDDRVQVSNISYMTSTSFTAHWLHPNSNRRTNAFE